VTADARVCCIETASNVLGCSNSNERLWRWRWCDKLVMTASYHKTSLYSYKRFITRVCVSVSFYQYVASINIFYSDATATVDKQQHQQQQATRSRVLQLLYELSYSRWKGVLLRECTNGFWM